MDWLFTLSGFATVLAGMLIVIGGKLAF